MVVPKQKPHRSIQTYATPWDFVHKVEKRLGIVQFAVDLAASFENRKAPEWLAEDDDSLSAEWDWAKLLESGWGWLNPPYTNIGAWAEKARDASLYAANIAMLVPALVGSNWFRDCVHRQAQVLALNGRIVFEGHTAGYPKDLILCLYGPQYKLTPDFDVWDWRKA